MFKNDKNINFLTKKEVSMKTKLLHFIVFIFTFLPNSILFNNYFNN